MGNLAPTPPVNGVSKVRFTSQSGGTVIDIADGALTGQNQNFTVTAWLFDLDHALELSSRVKEMLPQQINAVLNNPGASADAKQLATTIKNLFGI